MAAQPKKKISKVRSKTRRANWRGSLPNLTLCAKCKEAKLPHRACPKCGYYGRAKVISTKLEAKVAKTLDKSKPTKKTKPAGKANAKTPLSDQAKADSPKPKSTKKTINTPKRSGEEFHTDQS